MAKVIDLFNDSTAKGQALATSTATVQADKDKLAADQAQAAADAAAKTSSDNTLLGALKVTGPVLAGGNTLLENEAGTLRVLALPDAATVDAPDPTPAPAP